jgi:Ca2+-binding EF-hand superfamily protein
MAWIITPLVIVLYGYRWRQERDSNKAQNKELKKNFAELDLNGDGVITLTELKTGIEKQGRKFQKVS